jgi:hypothetical protein
MLTFATFVPMIFHIVTGDFAAVPLKATFGGNEQAEVVVMKDVLNVGPIKRPDGMSFSELRSQFWNAVLPLDKEPIIVDDLERLLRTLNELSKHEGHEVWVWVAPLPADMCTYFLVLRYAAKYLGRIKVVNIAGLPFLDKAGKLFFPKSLAELPEKEVSKAQKLARTVYAAELETDGTEWERLVGEDGGIRVLEGVRTITSKLANLYDSQLFTLCTDAYQKASKVVHAAMQQFNMPVGDLVLGWRLRLMVQDGNLQMQGDINKGLKDFEVKRHDGTLL